MDVDNNAIMECSAPGCSTTTETQIDGKPASLFSFPSDETLSKCWENKCKLEPLSEQSGDKLKLCERHFEPGCFDSEDKIGLKPNAVPTIFDFCSKRKNSPLEGSGNGDASPAKQIKLDESKQSSSENVKRADSKLTLNTISQVQRNLNGGGRPPSVFMKQIDMGKRVYRLIIRIDKVSDKVSEKISDKTLSKVPILPTVEPEARETKTPPKNVVAGCAKQGCKLMKTTLNSRPVFQCERCGKYYIVKQNHSSADNRMCYVCRAVLPSPDSLSLHMQEHFTCGMCQALCSTQAALDKHLRLHVSTNPSLPYKCHKCADAFEVKADLGHHYTNIHLKATKKRNVEDDSKKVEDDSNNSAITKQSDAPEVFRCEYCYMEFKKEKAYKRHVSLHTGYREYNCELCNKTFNNAKHLAAHHARHLGALKFACRVCSKEFQSVEAVDAHMKTHMEVVKEEHKCNICKKLFRSESLLNLHMRGHLSRAHRCPMCRKAFINKTTLRIHLKTHSKELTGNDDDDDDDDDDEKDENAAKTFKCTLCQGKFNNASRLYNHILTHLEQMHGEGDDIIQSLDGIIESVQDVLC